MAVEGVLIKIGTDQAVASFKKLDTAAAATFTQLAAKGTPAIAAVEKKLADLSEVTGTANKSTAQLAKGAGDTSQAMQKLFSATGQSGAAKGVGLLSSGAKLLVGAMNPLGVATGLVASAIIGFGSAAVAAQTDVGRLLDRIGDANRAFSVLQASADRGSQALASLADSAREPVAASDLDRFRQLTTSIEKQTAALGNLQTQLERSPDLQLGIDQAANLAEVLGLPAKAYRDLEKAAKSSGREQSKALSDLAEAGIQLQLSSAPGFFGANQEITLAAADAMAALQRSIDKSKASVADLSVRLAASTKPFDDLTEATRRLTEADGLGARTREVHAAIMANLGKRVDELGPKFDGLTEAQKKSIAAAYESAVAYDTAAEAAKTLEASARGAAEGANRRAKAFQDQELEGLKQRMLEVQSVGADVGATIGRGFIDAARAGDGLRSALSNIAQGLAEIAAQKIIVESLARLGAAFAGSFFGPGQGANIGPVQSNGQFARGGFLPSGEGPTQASRGLVLDRFQSFTRNGRNFTTNEGGAATPEAIVPLERDQYGRLGVHMAGAVQSYVVNMPNVRSAEEARRIRPTIRQTLDSIERRSGRNRSGLRAGTR